MYDAQLFCDFPATDLVILAGGQARRMQGQNKLLMQFDQQNQLLKILNVLEHQVAQVWINSHQDWQSYVSLNAKLKCFQDDDAGFFGPLMGMKSAWHYCQQDYVLFVPCDVTYIPADILAKMHQALAQVADSQVVYLQFNQQPLYPFCLMKREALAILQQQIAQQKLRLYDSFLQLHAQVIAITNCNISFHSLNSLEELQQYQQELLKANAAD